MATTTVNFHSHELSDLTSSSTCGGANTTTGSPSQPATNGKRRGGWFCAFLLLVNQALATLAFFGVAVNLVLFLRRVVKQDNAQAANSVSIWTGTVYCFSIVGAFLSDSYWGRFLTCGIFQLILVIGLALLSVSTSIFLLKPTGCGDGTLDCTPNSTLGQVIFYISLLMIALGYGGHQPTVATFGADQFDDDGEKDKADGRKATFFCYFYFALNFGSLFSNTILVYYEDNGYWTIGFLVSMGAALIGLCSYLMGYSRYRFVKAHGNPLPRVAQVFVAAFKKRRVVPGESQDELFEVQGSESVIKGSRKIKHSNAFKFMDKAATITEKDLITSPNTNITNPWRLCTITQVEEAKCILKLLPIWLTTIIYSIIFTQMASLFVEQGDVMNTSITRNFNIPAASMSVFDILSVLICTCIYRRILIPCLSKLTHNPKGLTELQRMGTGLIIGMLAMVAAGITEICRLRGVVDRDEKKSSMSIMWQVPQYVLVGASEVFMYVGQLEFFNGQAPDGIKSFGSSLCMASISFGNYASSLLVHVIAVVSGRGDGGSKGGWIPADNLNYGHMERWFFLIVGLTALDFVVYVFLARWYKPIDFGNNDENHEEGDEKEMDQDMDHKDKVLVQVVVDRDGRLDQDA